MNPPSAHQHPKSHSSRRSAIRYHLAGLEAHVAAELQQALDSHGCRPVEAARAADIVFCPPSGRTLESMLREAAGRPVIAVSRIPEVGQWLDALEAGAADYCAAPFENLHIRWLLDRYGRPAAARAVA